ncbi:MAG: YraN family protein [Chloroflexota bacterium]|nr:YraN family protein [Chloroflexota bacterium]
MTDNRKRLGAFGERVAGEYLKKHGYKILQTNFRCSGGEIDIVAQDGHCIAFVEVRTKRDWQYGTPEESITPTKKAKLIELAQTYVQENCEASQFWRIDVVAIEIGQRGQIARIELIQNAVE